MSSKAHWQQVYTSKAATEVSWFQAHAENPLRLIRESGIARTDAIIDIGGGASTLVDDLLVDGYRRISVLDLSAAALFVAQNRLGDRADEVSWIEADITRSELPANGFDLWHDRAAFHFLIEDEDRRRYVSTVLHAVKPGGHVIIATFAEDGPLKCSGLPVKRYDAAQLQAEFGEAFMLMQHGRESHRTPFDTIQQFTWCYFRKST